MQFNEHQVEIFRFTDIKKWHANVAVGDYKIDNKRITLPFGTFDTTRARDGYYLYENGVLKYKLLSTAGSI